MLSAFNDRFTATALMLSNHFLIVKTHLVDFSTLSASCTQKGHLNNRIQINVNTFLGVDELTRRRDEGHRNSRPWVQRERMNQSLVSGFPKRDSQPQKTREL
jgi:hypothetical protein